MKLGRWREFVNAYDKTRPLGFRRGRWGRRPVRPGPSAGTVSDRRCGPSGDRTRGCTRPESSPGSARRACGRWPVAVSFPSGAGHPGGADGVRDGGADAVVAGVAGGAAAATAGRAGCHGCGRPLLAVGTAPGGRRAVDRRDRRTPSGPRRTGAAPLAVGTAGRRRATSPSRRAVRRPARWAVPGPAAATAGTPLCAPDAPGLPPGAGPGRGGGRACRAAGGGGGFGDGRRAGTQSPAAPSARRAALTAARSGSEARPAW